MKIYHGTTGADLQEARSHAPSHTHGNCWTPDKMTPKDRPYILDNGAYRCFIRNEPWDADAFVGRLTQLASMPRDPDFVILPDVVTNPSKTRERAIKWAGVIDYTTAYPAQDGVEPEEAVELADRTDSETIFVGGTVEWKRRIGEDMVETAHDHGLRCHIGRPGDLTWAYSIGADSVDTTSIIRDKSWHRLDRLEAHSAQSGIREWTK